MELHQTRSLMPLLAELMGSAPPNMRVKSSRLPSRHLHDDHGQGLEPPRDSGSLARRRTRLGTWFSSPAYSFSGVRRFDRSTHN